VRLPLHEPLPFRPYTKPAGGFLPTTWWGMFPGDRSLTINP